MARLLLWQAAQMIATAVVAAVVAIGVTDTSLSVAWQAALLLIALVLAVGVAWANRDIQPSLREAQQEIDPVEGTDTSEDATTSAERVTRSAEAIEASIQNLHKEMSNLREEIWILRQPWWKRWRR